jgi:hypothetical protein
MMGDEIRISAEMTAPQPTGIFEHYCEHRGCAEWGSWGYSCTRQETRWYCFEHRNEGETLLGR